MNFSLYPEGITDSQQRLGKLLDQRNDSFDGTAVLGVGYQRKHPAALTKLFIIKLLLAYLYPLEVILELPLIPAPAPPPYILLPICLPILGSWLHHQLYHSATHFLAFFFNFLIPGGYPVCFYGFTSDPGSVQQFTMNLLIPEITADAIFPQPPHHSTLDNSHSSPGPLPPQLFCRTAEWKKLFCYEWV